MVEKKDWLGELGHFTFVSADDPKETQVVSPSLPLKEAFKGSGGAKSLYDTLQAKGDGRKRKFSPEHQRRDK